ncbi:MAG: hypothetical protein PVF73_10270 [Bacteroidales bacterium]|jgi:hypothetical protein
MTAEKFWMGWLKITMIIIIAAGVFFVILGNTDYAKILNSQINRIFYSGNIPEESVLLMRGWLIGIMGAVMAGWGSSMLYIVYHPFRRREKWAWRSIFYPVLIWFLLDSTVSACYDATFNVVINTVLFLQVLAPLLFLRKLFLRKVKPAS